MPAARRRRRPRAWVRARCCSPTGCDNDRRDVLQPGHRRHRQGPSGARDRRPGRADGPGGRPAGIQFKLLNRSKGPAVRGPRAQADRALVPAGHAGAAGRTARPGHSRGRRSRTLAIDAGGRVAWRRCLRRWHAPACGAAVLTAGTFLRGVIHVGAASLPGRPRRRGAVDRPGGALHGWSAARPAEDRHAAAAGTRRASTGTRSQADPATIRRRSRSALLTQRDHRRRRSAAA